MDFKLGTGFNGKQRVTGESLCGKHIHTGYLTILAFECNGIPAGWYISNEAKIPCAYPVKPRSINIIGFR